MPKFYDKIPLEQTQALTAAITSELIHELHLHEDYSSRLYGIVETTILHELSKDS